MAAPILSVVIPNHNYGHFLPRLVHCLKAQSLGLSDTEIIFVDDGSTDNSLALAEHWRGLLACPRFEIMRQRRVGRPGAVRNIGFEVARGDFLFALDPDDLLRPLFLESCLNVLQNRWNVDLVYTDYLESANGATRLIRLPNFDEDLLRTQNIVLPAVMRRHVWEQSAGFRVNTAYEDWDFWVQASLGGFSFVRLQTPLYIYERHGLGYSMEAARQDGLSKAMIVRNNPEFFDPLVRRWARGLVQSEPWALPFQTGLIPRPEDVTQFLEIFVTASHNYRQNRPAVLAAPHLRLLAVGG